MPNNLMVFSGNANPELAQKVAKWLGVPLGRAEVRKFSDGEINVELNENVRGKDVFVLQPTCCADQRQPDGTGGHDRRAAPHRLPTRITAVVPYFGYARQDRRVRSARVPISAKVVADMIIASGVDRVLTVDLHAEQIQGFFRSRWITCTAHRC
jgi:ribose-phosphate pyrophosphokinase